MRAGVRAEGIPCPELKGHKVWGGLLLGIKFNEVGVHRGVCVRSSCLEPGEGDVVVGLGVHEDKRQLHRDVPGGGTA